MSVPPPAFPASTKNLDIETSLGDAEPDRGSSDLEQKWAIDDLNAGLITSKLLRDCFSLAVDSRLSLKKESYRHRNVAFRLFNDSSRLPSSYTSPSDS